MVQVAMERAIHAQRHVLEFGSNCTNNRQKFAWADCLKLYDNTVLQLNHTLQGLQPNSSCTDFDVQTWLSTAFTNIQTCRAGSVDLNVSDFILPLVSTNVSELISNSLAINGVLLEKETHSVGFPSWVSAHERKLLQSSSLASKAKLVVDKYGSGNFRTIQAAINAAATSTGSGRFIIHVKRGVYSENIEVGNNVNNILLVGDGMKYTIVTGSRSVVGGYTTYSSATAGIDGFGFMAVGITFRNTAGPQNGQAVALRSSSDLSVFYRCAFQGYQDTLMVLSQRQFYKACYIYGTIDFIFGNAAVVFQNCMIYARRPLQGQANVITAQGRGDPNQNTAISIHNSRILAAPDLKPVVKAFKTYLGRPWQQYSRTVILKTYMDSLVHPMGWSAWDNTNVGLDTLYYGEYKNFGPGSSTRWRVRWRGYHVITSSTVASQFTVGSLIAGQSWLPATGVPFTSGL
ncbi:hypothetical protein L1049_021018 [Liquidambar formosana]|uniref:Pectinesterase n=1 Tax=Liquidambar formosana TaxID=63359 RepID=A0AAP0X4T3_LIQFO